MVTAWLRHEPELVLQALEEGSKGLPVPEYPEYEGNYPEKSGPSAARTELTRWIRTTRMQLQKGLMREEKKSGVVEGGRRFRARQGLEPEGATSTSSSMKFAMFTPRDRFAPPPCFGCAALRLPPPLLLLLLLLLLLREAFLPPVFFKVNFSLPLPSSSSSSSSSLSLSEDKSLSSSSSSSPREAAAVDDDEDEDLAGSAAGGAITSSSSSLSELKRSSRADMGSAPPAQQARLGRRSREREEPLDRAARVEGSFAVSAFAQFLFLKVVQFQLKRWSEA